MALVSVTCSSCNGRQIPDHTCEDCKGSGSTLIHTSQIVPPRYNPARFLGTLLWIDEDPEWPAGDEQLELFIGVDMGTKERTVAVSSMDSQGNVTLHDLIQMPTPVRKHLYTCDSGLPEGKCWCYACHGG